MFPTPSSSSYGTNQGGAAGRVGPVRESLETMARRETAKTGRLNPAWVATLMGFPSTWLDISGPPRAARTSTCGSPEEPSEPT